MTGLRRETRLKLELACVQNGYIVGAEINGTQRQSFVALKSVDVTAYVLLLLKEFYLDPD